MKWICEACKAINPQFSYECHCCGSRNPVVGSKTPTELVPQGKYECGAAALAVLLGHTLFNVKRVLGDCGWRNDFDGVTEKQLRYAARAFGRDLVWCNYGMLDTMKYELPMPNAVITIRSLNYKKKWHGIAYYEGQVIDPNFGMAGRKYWFADADLKCIGISSASIITKRPLTDAEYSQIESLRKAKMVHSAMEHVLKVAG